jgi:carboxyvinyl-carboxyphosphonate phosphorylmutase
MKLTTRPGQQLREVLAGNACVRPASVFDPLSACAAAELGFELCFLAGSVASLAVLGAPDLNLLSLTEFADLARRICRAQGPPLLVDADHGFGNAENVRRTVRELFNAGVAGMTLEDTALPAPPGEPARMIPLDEALFKLAAALDERAADDFVVIARTSAWKMGNHDTALERVRAYAAAGADAIFALGPRTLAEVAQVHEAAGDVPLMLYTMGEVADPAQLAALNARILLVDHRPFALSTQAAHAMLAAQRAGSAPPLALDPELVARLSQVGRYAARHPRTGSERDD